VTQVLSHVVKEVGRWSAGLSQKLNNIRANSNVTFNEYDDDNDEYGFVNSGATQSISPQQVVTCKKLADGKFAVVKTGALTIGNEMHPVAVKMLKRL